MWYSCEETIQKAYYMEHSLSGKTIVVMGATSGIGLVVAEALVQRGATVIGIGRSPDRCREAESRLHFIQPEARVDYLVAELSLQSQIRSLKSRVGGLLAREGKAGLDGLVNNAGTFTFWLAYTPEGFEMQWAVNHLAPFLLTHELLTLLEAAPSARVVTVSSGSHRGVRLKWEDVQLRRCYNGLRAYQQTKLANVLFTLELNHRLGPQSPVHAFAADPGLVNTEIGLKGTPALVRWVWDWRRTGGIKPEEAARGIVFLLEDPAIQDSPEVYWRRGVPVPASPFALDPEAARRLWALSEQMCGLGAGDKS
jgi:NAD(P)-dependent dehydrogenase (short-subunit alcohol dehydrogenase family)